MEAVPSWLTLDYIRNRLQNFSSISGMRAEPASNEGINYLSKILRITLLCEEKEEKLIAKLKIKTAIEDLLVDEHDLFDLEIKFFENFWPGIEARVGGLAPKFYGVDKEHGAIFLEDLCAHGFTQLPRQNFMNLQECLLAFEALAALHGASFYALRENASLKEKFRPLLTGDQPNEFFSKFYDNIKVVLGRLVPTYGLTEDFSEKLLKFDERYRRENFENCDLKEDKLNFLVHGDASKNNMMFRYKTGVVDSVKLIDFQTIHYNSFANDLHYLLFTSAQADVIVNSIDLLLEKYFVKLQSIARDVPNLTIERIRAEFSERFYYGFLQAVGFRGVILSPKTVDFAKILNGEIDELGYGNPVFVSDMRKLLPFFVKNGAI